MGIRKQEFYEGAAICRLVKGGSVGSLCYEAPFFVANSTCAMLIKYSTGIRSPWAFTFTPDEQAALRLRGGTTRIVVGLVCGDDGVAALPYEAYLSVAAPRPTGLRIACRRLHGEWYEVSGPDGRVAQKVSPSTWQKLLSE